MKRLLTIILVFGASLSPALAAKKDSWHDFGNDCAMICKAGDWSQNPQTNGWSCSSGKIIKSKGCPRFMIDVTGTLNEGPVLGTTIPSLPTDGRIVEPARD